MLLFDSFNEDDTPAEYFGQQLLASGYNYHGNEPMYSGITGKEFSVDIYLGVVYYQRLRHMVGDKWQVRTEGPIDSVTRQPIKVSQTIYSMEVQPSDFLLFLNRVVSAVVVSDSVKWSVMRFLPMAPRSCFKIVS